MNILHPSGDIALQQRDILVISAGLMLLIIIPVMILTVLFAWRYRQSNKKATYKPDWDHSTQLELIIWSAPLLIIICLGAMTWLSTHLLDPYRSLGRISANEGIKSDVAPLEIDAVALDWKWLFIYPSYGIATMNELALPINVPVDFHITASSVMNSFFVPDIAGQIYAMPGMETRLSAVVNKRGTYRGFSANYSGAGFSGMHFNVKAFDAGQFDAWVTNVKSRRGSLDRGAYLALERPSENEPVRSFGIIDRSLFGAILNMCVEPGKMCMSKMSAIDAKGGMGLKSAYNLLPFDDDKPVRRGAVLETPVTHVADLCVRPDKMSPFIKQASTYDPGDPSPLLGAGLSPRADQ